MLQQPVYSRHCSRKLRVLAHQPFVDEIYVNKILATAMQHKHQIQSVEPNGRYQAVPEQVIYEQPLNERIRTLLRLEFLFEQASAHTYRHSTWVAHGAVVRRICQKFLKNSLRETQHFLMFFTMLHSGVY